MANVTGAALVVGGASGIGQACAAALTQDGWPVVVADLKPDREPPAGVALDVRDRDAVRAAIEQVAQGHDGIGAVVYAAGTARLTPLVEIEPREWELITQVNLTGMLNVLQAAVPHVPPGGSFTLISSVDSGGPGRRACPLLGGEGRRGGAGALRGARVRSRRDTLQRSPARCRANAADGEHPGPSGRHRGVRRTDSPRPDRGGRRRRMRWSPSSPPQRRAGSPERRFRSTVG